MTMVLAGPAGAIAAGSGWDGTRAWGVAAVVLVLTVLARRLRGRFARRRTGRTGSAAIDPAQRGAPGGGGL